VGDNFLVVGQWTDPAMSGRCTTWAQEAYGKMERFFAAGRYVNYLGDDEAGDPAAAAYGVNYKRLQETKKKYDPQNFFRMNQNIKPLA
jgi:FAD/FMN-containing dehydrogenase